MKKYLIFVGTCLVVFLLVNLMIRFTSCPPQERIDEAVSYAKSHGMRTDYVVLVDFSTHSGKPRFWIYDVDDKSVKLKSLCAHGCGEGNTVSKAKLSNKPGSNCSSKGMYRIENFHEMANGLPSLKLSGLSSTNSNAYYRGILIHPSKLITSFGLGSFPLYIPLTSASEGCFAINSSTFNSVLAIASEQEKRLLLYAYE